MWQPTPPAAYYHDSWPVFSPIHTTILLQPPRVLTHRYKTHIKWRGTMWWRRTLFLSCMRTQRNTAHALWLPPKKIISAFLYFTLEACPPLYYSFLLSHTFHYSQIHFPISQIYFSLSLWNLKKPKMAKIALLFVLCVLPALAIGSRPMSNPFNVQGRVYCDTCRAGFETSATTYIPGN